MSENWNGDSDGRNSAGRRPPSSIRQGVVPDRAPSHAGPSESPPNAQPSSPPFNECEPERKRQKLDVSRTESDAEPSHANTKESAALRFFAVPELLSLVLRHFDYEKTELLILSCVSKRMRANVLPHLVESLDVPFTKAKNTRIYLESTPGLASHVRYLRLWDDIGRHYCNRRPLPDEDSIPMGYRNQIPPPLLEDMWTQLGSLLSLLHDKSRFQLPFVDLYVGVSSIGQLYVQLEQRPQLVERLTALRLVDDFCPSRHGSLSASLDEVMHSMEKHVQRYSEHLEDLLRLICEVQDGKGSQAFQFFGITGSSSAFDGTPRIWFLPNLSPKVLVSVAKRVQHLSIVLNELSPGDLKPYQALLDPDWPQLLTFNVRRDRDDWDEEWPWLDAFEASTHAFCQRHPTLTRAGVEIHEVGVPYWVRVTLPNVTACSLNIDDSEASRTGLDFVLHHEKIEQLSLAEKQTHAYGRALASHLPLRESLRFLRAGPHAVRHFLRKDTKLQHIQVMGDEVIPDPEFDTGQDADVRRWSIFPDARRYSSITCVEYSIAYLSLNIIFADMARILCPSQLPNLTEFCLFIGSGFKGDSRDSEDLGALFLAEMLGVLNECDRLRAAWFGCNEFTDLPPDEELNELVGTLPPRLEYMTWHMPFNPTTHHYRVVQPVPITAEAHSFDYAPTPDSPTEGVGTTRSMRTPGPSRKAKEAQTKSKWETRMIKDKPEKPPKALLEKLPASFRPKVDKRTGRWEDMDDE
ncbi:hypothetical protein CF319_g9057, partial [Tilletia indica]